jgi:hypothetical protein
MLPHPSIRSITGLRNVTPYERANSASFRALLHCTVRAVAFIQLQARIRARSVPCCARLATSLRLASRIQYRDHQRVCVCVFITAGSKLEWVVVGGDCASVRQLLAT